MSCPELVNATYQSTRLFRRNILSLPRELRDQIYSTIIPLGTGIVFDPSAPKHPIVKLLSMNKQINAEARHTVQEHESHGSVSLTNVCSLCLPARVRWQAQCFEPVQLVLLREYEYDSIALYNQLTGRILTCFRYCNIFIHGREDLDGEDERFIVMAIRDFLVAAPSRSIVASAVEGLLSLPAQPPWRYSEASRQGG
jgi:hypothetical protein